MAPALIPLIAAGLSFGIKAITSAKQKHAAEQITKDNIRPDYSIQAEYERNQRLAAQAAETGLTPEAKAYYEDLADEGFASGTNAILEGGGDLNTIGNLYQNRLQSDREIAARDSEARLQNIKNAMAANAELAGQKSMQWSLNEYEPYKDKAKQAAALRDSSNLNLQSGLGDVMSGVGSYLTSTMYDKLLNPPQQPISNASLGTYTPATPYELPATEVPKIQAPGAITEVPNPITGVPEPMTQKVNPFDMTKEQFTNFWKLNQLYKG